MNILIVNAFGNSTSEKTRFTNFCTIIKNIFKKVAEKSGIDNFVYIYRTAITIGDYIYNYESNPGEGSKDNTNNKKNFDKIDMVFIDGIEKYLPWEDKGYRLSEFVRLCKATNKVLYAGGVALEILIYYLATGSNNVYNFINSHGEIQAVEEIKRIPQKFLKDLKKNDNFLDYVTGDILEYRSIDKTWVPVMNIGLHKQIAAEKYMSRGKFVLPDNFRGKDYIKNENAIVSNCHEILVNVTRQYLSHYLVENLPVEFAAFSSLSWFPHYFNVSYKKYFFKAICLSDKGIVVIEHENSVGVAFHPQVHYKETINLLENFIKQKFQEVRIKVFQFKTNKKISNPDNDLPLMFRKYKLNDDEQKRKKNFEEANSLNLRSFEKYRSFIGKVNDSRPFSRVKKVKSVATYVGFGMNNRDMVFVESNAIIQKPLNFSSKKQKESLTKEYSDFGKKSGFFIKRNENTRISEIFKPVASSFAPMKESGRNNMKDFDKIKEFIDKDEENGLDYLTFIKRDEMDENQLISFYKRTRKNVCQKLEEIESTSKFRFNTQKNTRNNSNNISVKKSNKKYRLKTACNTVTNSHNFKISQEKEENNNLQNNLKNNKTEENNIQNNDIIMEEAYQKLMGKYPRPVSNMVYVKSAKNNLKKALSSRKIIQKNNTCYNIGTEECRFNKAQSYKKDKWKEYENISPEQRERKEFLESKKKWVSKQDFHRVFGLHTTSIKPIPNIMSYGIPVTAHRYRDIHPEKWMTPNGFV